MSRRTHEYIRQLYEGVSGIVTSEKSFTCVYGSVLNGHSNARSDIDFFVAAPYFTQTERQQLSRFAKEFHLERSLETDEEVPYDNKVAVMRSDLRDATLLKGLAIKDGRILVPAIEKTDQFLSSREVKLRLIFNALTVPHSIDSESDEYQRYRSNAEEKLFLLAVDLADQRGINPNIIDNLIRVLLSDEDGNEGEMYLGYKNYDLVIRRLEDILTKEMKKMNAAGSNLVFAVLTYIKQLAQFS